MKENKKKKNIIILLILPFIYLFLSFGLYALKGPNWVLIPQDLGYNYLISSVNFLEKGIIGSIIHPALTNIYINSILLKIYFLIFTPQESILNSVIQNPEFYFGVISSVLIIITSYLIFFNGKLILSRFDGINYALIFQSFIFITSPTIFLLNNFSSPESILTIISLLITIILIKISEVKNDKRKNIYIALLGLLTSLAIATKFISLPFFILSIFILNKKKEFILFFFTSIFSLIILFFPLLNEINKFQFLNDMFGLFSTLVRENTELKVNFFQNYFYKLLGFIYSYKIFFFVVFINITLLFFSNKKKLKLTQELNNLRKISYACFYLTITSIIFLTFRHSGGKYSYLYLPYIFLSYVICLKIINENKIISLKKIKFCLIFFIIIVFSFFTKNSVKEGSIFRENYLKSKEIAKIAFSNSDNAIITQISASNINTALYHSFLTSNKMNVETFRKFDPNNHYNYNLFYGKAYKYGSGSFEVKELKNMYKDVYFWTSIHNFQNINENKPPNVIYKIISESKSERLIKVISYWFDKYQSKMKNSSNWKKVECDEKKVCIIYSNINKKELIDHIIFSKTNVRDIFSLSNVKLEGSNDKIFWKEIVLTHNKNKQIFNNYKYNNIFKIKDENYYKFYKIKLDKEYFPEVINLYSSSDCSNLQRIITVSNKFIKKKDNLSNEEKWFIDEIKKIKKDSVNFNLNLRKEVSTHQNLKYFFSFSNSFFSINFSMRSPSIENQTGKIPGSEYKYSSSYPIYFFSEFLKSEKLTSYEIFFDNKNKDFIPQKWVLLASNDNSNWDVIDEVENKNVFDDNIIRFNINVKKKYKYIKFKILQNLSGTEFAKFINIKYYTNNINANKKCYINP